jgi:uncharacterized protein YggE
MEMRHSFFGAIIFALLLLAGAFFIPWQSVDWGKIQLSPTKTITVVGEAETKEKNQVATFTAGVSAVNDNKETAIDEVNQKIKTIIDSVKDFAIASEDIKTQNLSVNQMEESYYEEGVQKSRPGQWRVNNSINITLRDVDRASALADLLSQSGATNVYGPNFTVEETQTAEKSLLEEAIKNAREKAEILAKSSGGQLGKIISVSESSQPSTIYRGLEGIGGGGGAPVEPGTSKISKVVTVVFELK